MPEGSIALKQYREALIDKARKEGFEIGFEEGFKIGFKIGLKMGAYEIGAFELALKIKRHYGLKQAVLISGFSPEELESEKINHNFRKI